MERVRTAGPVEYKLADDEGDLDRPLRVDRWFAPGLRLKDGCLQVDGRYWPGRLVTPKPPMLEKFVQLGAPGRESSQAVLTYARKWGLLNLCQHHLPIDHEDLQVPISFAVTGAAHYTFELPGPCLSSWVLGGEPVSTWFYWSRQAAAILAIVSRLREDEWARKVDWSTLGEEGPWMDGAQERLDDFRRNAKLWKDSLVEGYQIQDASAAEVERARREVEQSVASGAIETWLRLAGAVFELRWPSHGAPRVGFRVNGLFGALGLQLLQAAADSTGFAICAGCPNLIALRRERGRPWRYCADCQASHIPQRLADQRRQQKKPKSESASQDQTPTVG